MTPRDDLIRHDGLIRVDRDVFHDDLEAEFEIRLPEGSGRGYLELTGYAGSTLETRPRHGHRGVEAHHGAEERRIVR